MKRFIERFYSNHVLANLFFAMVLITGFLSFMQMPREQDPTINFNWIDITTVVPGMAAADIEKRVTDILEDEIDGISDIKFVSSNSRESYSSILVRFEDRPVRRPGGKRRAYPGGSSPGLRAAYPR